MTSTFFLSNRTSNVTVEKCISEIHETSRELVHVEQSPKIPSRLTQKFFSYSFTRENNSL